MTVPVVLVPQAGVVRLRLCRAITPSCPSGRCSASSEGRDRIADSWLMPQDSPMGLRFLSTRANGQLALGVYKLDAARNLYMPSCLEVFGLRGELISEVTSFRNPELIRVFGLPEKLRP